jgi:deoxyribodipyrimidine photo-lyase
MQHTFTPTREAALRRLDAFLPSAAADYTAMRNHDLGPGRRDNVSMLSPFIRHRLITEREVCAAVLERHTAGAAEKFIQEVMWRTYWKGWLEMRPGVWTRYQRDLAIRLEALDANSGLRRNYQAATEGCTGIDGFDDWARELTATGYLHNHARMWFASIWIFTLRLPWELGADVFMRHLLDGDAAANTLSWRWVAGLQTKGKTYAATRENIRKCTDGRFDPKGLATNATALEEPPLEAAGPLPLRPRHFAEPCAALLTDDDYGVETLPLAWGQVNAVAVADLAAGRTAHGVSAAVQAFGQGAALDTLSRVQSLAVHADVIGKPITRLDMDDVLRWLRQAGRRTLVIPETPVGATADAISALVRSLESHGINIVRLRRSWDTAAWPLATKGFFPFKERIPELLRQENLM